METIEHLTARLDSLRDLQSVVGTMKALAAVSIHQFEEAVAALRDYHATVERGLEAIMTSLPPQPPARPSPGPSAVIVFGTDHGLCGRFNEEAVDAAPAADRRIAVGLRAAALLAERGELDAELGIPGAVPRIAGLVNDLLDRVEAWQAAGVAAVDLVYNRQMTTARYEPVVARLLPVDLPRFRLSRWQNRSLPGWREPTATVLSGLLRQYFFVALYRACGESLAAENGSRLAAMQAAESNLAEHLETLTGEYRRARQDRITAELLDVVTGYEAMGGEDA